MTREESGILSKDVDDAASFSRIAVSFYCTFHSTVLLERFDFFFKFSTRQMIYTFTHNSFHNSLRSKTLVDSVSDDFLKDLFLWVSFVRQFYSRKIHGIVLQFSGIHLQVSFLTFLWSFVPFLRCWFGRHFADLKPFSKVLVRRFLKHFFCCCSGFLLLLLLLLYGFLNRTGWNIAFIYAI